MVIRYSLVNNKHDDSFGVGVGQSDLAVALNGEEEAVLLVVQVEQRCVIFAVHSQVLLFQEEIDHAVRLNVRDMRILRTLMFSSRVQVQAIKSVLKLKVGLEKLLLANESECDFASYWKGFNNHSYFGCPQSNFDVEQTQVGMVIAHCSLSEQLSVVGDVCRQ